MTERGLPIVDGAPACPFVAFADDRDERAGSPDHRHRCYAEAQPAPRALAHQEAYCLSSAFPVCPTFQDWARREAARARDDAGRTGTGAGAAEALDAGGQPQRNPPRNWAAPPPWLTRGGNRGAEPPAGSLWADDDPDEEPPQGRGLSGSYADRVASGPSAPEPGSIVDDADEAYLPPVAPVVQVARPVPATTAPVMPAYRPPDAPGDEEEAVAGEPPPRIRHRERELVHGDRPGRPDGKRTGPAPEWERAKPMEAYPTIRSRRLSELSIPPILVAVVALALAAAVLFALPGLLGFGSPAGAGASASPTLPVTTAIPSINPTPVPQPTQQIYLVQSGDTMSRIAGRFGIPLNELIAANTQTVPDPNKLKIGQEIIIPAKAVVSPSEIPAAS
ncbi:MAG TPA: LysM peptidoglycan-binding domain-containing protein [Candidatus Dormibacteraeota bacterium]|nr:LysM peptidoglycan-binding domain-containing protein [Candidatus Dormibacteraeota bacterium]